MRETEAEGREEAVVLGVRRWVGELAAVPVLLGVGAEVLLAGGVGVLSAVLLALPVPAGDAEAPPALALTLAVERAVDAEDCDAVADAVPAVAVGVKASHGLAVALPLPEVLPPRAGVGEEQGEARVDSVVVELGVSLAVLLAPPAPLLLEEKVGRGALGEALLEPPMREGEELPLELSVSAAAVGEGGAEVEAAGVPEVEKVPPAAMPALPLLRKEAVGARGEGVGVAHAVPAPVPLTVDVCAPVPVGAAALPVRVPLTVTLGGGCRVPVAQGMGEGVKEELLLPCTRPVPDTVAVAAVEPSALCVDSAVPVPPQASMDAEAEALPPPPPLADTEEEPLEVLLPLELREVAADTLVVRVG